VLLVMGDWAHVVGQVLDEAAIACRRELAISREGFATWAAWLYWLEWKGVRSFRFAIASYQAAGMYLPLHENDGFLDTLSEDAAQRFGEDCLYYRDLIYTEWGGRSSSISSKSTDERSCTPCSVRRR